MRANRQRERTDSRRRPVEYYELGVSLGLAGVLGAIAVVQEIQGEVSDKLLYAVVLVCLVFSGRLADFRLSRDGVEGRFRDRAEHVDERDRTERADERDA